ncbi:uncharacterized protein [Cherax quadricarinatus]
MRQVNPKYNQCSEIYHEKTAGLNHINDAKTNLSDDDKNKNVITLCCSFQEYLQCSERVVFETCGNETALFTKEFLDRMAGPIVQDICQAFSFSLHSCLQDSSTTSAGIPLQIPSSLMTKVASPPAHHTTSYNLKNSHTLKDLTASSMHHTANTNTSALSRTQLEHRKLFLKESVGQSRHFKTRDALMISGADHDSTSQPPADHDPTNYPPAGHDPTSQPPADHDPTSQPPADHDPTSQLPAMITFTHGTTTRPLTLLPLLPLRQGRGNYWPVNTDSSTTFKTLEQKSIKENWHSENNLNKNEIFSSSSVVRLRYTTNPVTHTMLHKLKTRELHEGEELNLSTLSDQTDFLPVPIGSADMLDKHKEFDTSTNSDASHSSALQQDQFLNPGVNLTINSLSLLNGPTDGSVLTSVPVISPSVSEDLQPITFSTSFLPDSSITSPLDSFTRTRQSLGVTKSERSENFHMAREVKYDHTAVKKRSDFRNTMLPSRLMVTNGSTVAANGTRDKHVTWEVDYSQSVRASQNITSLASHQPRIRHSWRHFHPRHGRSRSRLQMKPKFQSRESFMKRPQNVTTATGKSGRPRRPVRRRPFTEAHRSEIAGTNAREAMHFQHGNILEFTNGKPNNVTEKPEVRPDVQEVITSASNATGTTSHTAGLRRVTTNGILPLKHTGDEHISRNISTMLTKRRPHHNRKPFHNRQWNARTPRRGRRRRKNKGRLLGQEKEESSGSVVFISGSLPVPTSIVAGTIRSVSTNRPRVIQPYPSFVQNNTFYLHNIRKKKTEINKGDKTETTARDVDVKPPNVMSEHKVNTHSGFKTGEESEDTSLGSHLPITTPISDYTQQHRSRSPPSPRSSITPSTTPLIFNQFDRHELADRVSKKKDEAGSGNKSSHQIQTGRQQVTHTLQLHEVSAHVNSSSIATNSQSNEDISETLTQLSYRKHKIDANGNKQNYPESSVSSSITQSPSDGHVTITQSPSDGHVTITQSPSDGHVTIPQSPSDGHVTITQSPSDGHVTITQSPSDGHVTITQSPSDGHFTLTESPKVEDNMTVMETKTKDQTTDAKKNIKYDDKHFYDEYHYNDHDLDVLEHVNCHSPEKQSVIHDSNTLSAEHTRTYKESSIPLADDEYDNLQTNSTTHLYNTSGSSVHGYNNSVTPEYIFREFIPESSVSIGKEVEPYYPCKIDEDGDDTFDTGTSKFPANNNANKYVHKGEQNNFNEKHFSKANEENSVEFENVENVPVIGRSEEDRKGTIIIKVDSGDGDESVLHASSADSESALPSSPSDGGPIPPVSLSGGEPILPASPSDGGPILPASPSDDEPTLTASLSGGEPTLPASPAEVFYLWFRNSLQEEVMEAVIPAPTPVPYVIQLRKAQEIERGLSANFAPVVLDILESDFIPLINPGPRDSEDFNNLDMDMLTDKYFSPHKTENSLDGLAMSLDLSPNITSFGDYVQTLHVGQENKSASGADMEDLHSDIRTPSEADMEDSHSDIRTLKADMEASHSNTGAPSGADMEDSHSDRRIPLKADMEASHSNTGAPSGADMEDSHSDRRIPLKADMEASHSNTGAPSGADMEDSHSDTGTPPEADMEDSHSDIRTLKADMEASHSNTGAPSGADMEDIHSDRRTPLKADMEASYSNTGAPSGADMEDSHSDTGTQLEADTENSRSDKRTPLEADMEDGQWQTPENKTKVLSILENSFTQSELHQLHGYEKNLTETLRFKIGNESATAELDAINTKVAREVPVDHKHKLQESSVFSHPSDGSTLIYPYLRNVLLIAISTWIIL